MVYCDNAYGNYASFLDARTACAVDAGCGAVYDPACDDTGQFRLCPTNWNEQPCSTCTSCIFPKLGNNSLQYHFIVLY